VVIKLTMCVQTAMPVIGFLYAQSRETVVLQYMTASPNDTYATLAGGRL
jgi:hypothetical protein